MRKFQWHPLHPVIPMGQEQCENSGVLFGLVVMCILEKAASPPALVRSQQLWLRIAISVRGLLVPATSDLTPRSTRIHSFSRPSSGHQACLPGACNLMFYES